MEKIKKLNLYKKDLRLNTIILAFIMKAYPFIKEENHKDFFNKIKDFWITLKGKYIKLYNYFNKYWKDSRLFNFTNLNNELIKNRINNIVESFHSKINKDIHNKYIINLSKSLNEKKYNYIANDIIKFIKIFANSHRIGLGVENLNQFLKQEDDNFYKLNLSILNNVSDFKDETIDNLKYLFIRITLLINKIILFLIMSVMMMIIILF